MEKKEVRTPAYSVKKLASLAGVSVRTLHLYDELRLLTPAHRTEAGYRMYGEKELLRLQQILFYKELDFSLQEIQAILDDPDFDVVHALETHKQALQSRKDRLTTLLTTIDKTIIKLKNSMALSHEELYEGFPREKAATWRNEAIEQYGTKAVEKSEHYLRSLGKEGFSKLKEENAAVTHNLLQLMNEDPTSEQVQMQIKKHYEVIRKFWGTHDTADSQLEAYAGLGDLYVHDERFTFFAGEQNREFALFMSKAMKYFAG